MFLDQKDTVPRRTSVGNATEVQCWRDYNGDAVIDRLDAACIAERDLELDQLALTLFCSDEAVCVVDFTDILDAARLANSGGRRTE